MNIVLNELKKIINNSEAILITAGAGMGVDSGLPDFRSNEGFWKAYPPMKELGLSFERLASPKWFEKDPALAWGFYGHRLNLYRKTIPHRGFALLKALVEAKQHNYFIYTSNVDGQFQKAGFDDMKIVECHGSIHYNQCAKSCSSILWSNCDDTVEVDETLFRAKEPMPSCLICQELARPNILMFGDGGWNSNRKNEQSARFALWRDKVMKEAESLCIIEIGAGENIPTVRDMGEHLCKKIKATLIRINPKDTWVPSKQYSLKMGGLDGLESLLA
jgi:NAD-dependent SIR2 family protein deacetylase